MLHYAKPLPSHEFLKDRFTYDSTNAERPLIGPSGRNIGRGLVNKHRSNYKVWQTTIGHNEFYTTSRLVWKLHHGTDPVGVIDHIDGNSSNNLIENLRDISQQENIEAYHASKK